MALQVTGKNLDIGEALRSHVTDRIEATVDKYTGQTPSGHVRIEKAHGAFLTGCTIQLRSGLSLESHGEAHDAYASFDQSLERLEKRLRKLVPDAKIAIAHGKMAPADLEKVMAAF
ncbi:MAG: ribosome-associated translation inhibitor RaiA, partial [Proteobacteria bacterium]|nr:ribosome-associated translation inhibitor RaiA [Pseudomonadota bacterium]